MKFFQKIIFLSLLSVCTLFALEYKSPDFAIENVHLTFHLDEARTQVISELEFRRVGDNTKTPLVLSGEKLKLISVFLDHKQLQEDEYVLDENSLTLPKVSNHFHLTVVNEICPKENTTLEGLYLSNGIFCTQNESKGFRKITYFLDRPDVMTKYTTKIIADKKAYPILLSNGNKVDFGDLKGGKHFVVWEDPYKKPSYLFALVAGDLGYIEDTFVRKTGKPVDLKIFCEKGLEYKCGHAMNCLKKAMKWDEERFDRICDLDTYMVVAINDFNSGAMENKGLNIFNSSLILADPKSSTDANFTSIEGVIGHEYFHNWTGNRVTLRDWNELNVKEALTVFRDQEFSLDMNSWTRQRIEDVSILKLAQFPEDAGPTAHSIRPTEEIETRNLYSATVYCKGPEVVRMLQTLLGKEMFKKGLNKYFELYDGQAVTTHQFLETMQLVSQKDLSQFERWYDQKGTPHLHVSSNYNSSLKKFELTIEQSNPKEGSDPLALHIPLKIGLLDSNGNDIPLKNDLLEIKNKKQTFVFDNIQSKPILSLNRDFSAPVIIDYDYSQEEQIFLMAHDTNEFNRWEAARTLNFEVMQSLVDKYQNQEKLELPQAYTEAFALLLGSNQLDAAVKAESLILPSERELAQTQPIIDFEANHFVRDWMKQELAKANEQKFLTMYQQLQDQTPYSIEADKIAQRQLKNVCLGYLTSLEKPEYIDLCLTQFSNATNMTDQFAALSFINQVNCPQRREALDEFYEKWQNDSLVINKWLALEGSSPCSGTLEEVKALLKHPAFKRTEPNKNRALLGSFLRNSVHFHAKDGSGYFFFQEQISEIDEINPHLAANLAIAFRDYSKLDSNRKKLMKECLENLLQKEGLSHDTYEIINKTLAES